MSFQLERNMTSIVIDNMNKFIRNTGEKDYRESYIYACEVPIYYRIVDMAIASFCTKYNQIEECKNYEKLLKKLSSKCFTILVFISTKKKISFSKLQETFFMEKNELIKCLDKLCFYKLIKRVSKFSYSIGDWSYLIPRELVAIELKLSKWKEALEQARFNQRFAEFSYVILDEDRVKKKDYIIEEYKANNIGLIYLNKNGNIKVMYKPRKNRKLDIYDSNYHKIKILKDFISNEDKWKGIP